MSPPPGEAPPAAGPPSDWSRVPPPGPARGSFRVGLLVGRSFRIWARHVLLFAVLGAIGNLPMAVGTYQLYTRLPAMAAADPRRAPELLAQMGKVAGSFAMLWLASMVVMSLMMAAICQGAAQALRGDRVRLGPMLAAAIHRAPYVLAVTLLVMLAALATSCTVVGPVLLLVGW